MSSWNATTLDGDGKVLAHMRLGTYEPPEAGLKPSQYPGDFSASDGIFLTTTGDLYLNAGKTVDVEFEDAAEILLGDFAEDSDVVLKIDATAGSGFASFTGSGVAINAVASSSQAQAPTEGQLILYASEAISTTSTGDTRFHSAGDVYIANDTESNSSTQSKTFTMGSALSVVMYSSVEIVAGFHVVVVAGIRTSVAIYTSETIGIKFGYSIMSNEIALAKSENKGVGAYLKNISGLIGVLMQEDELAEVKQEEFENGTTGGKIVNRLVGAKSGAVASHTGVQSTM